MSSLGLVGFKPSPTTNKCPSLCLHLHASTRSMSDLQCTISLISTSNLLGTSNRSTFNQLCYHYSKFLHHIGKYCSWENYCALHFRLLKLIKFVPTSMIKLEMTCWLLGITGIRYHSCRLYNFFIYGNFISLIISIWFISYVNGRSSFIKITKRDWALHNYTHSLIHNNSLALLQSWHSL